MGSPPSIGGLCGDEMLPNFPNLGHGGVPFKWLLPEPSRTRGIIPALVLRPFLFFLRLATPALRLGVIGSLRPSVLLILRRYGRRSGQPSSSSLARRACVHSSCCSAFLCMASLVLVPFKFVYWDTLTFGSAPGLSGGRGEMAMAVASSARLAFLRGAVCACCMPYTSPCTAMVQ